MAPSPSPRNGTTSSQATPTRTPNYRTRLNFMSRPSISPSPNNINAPPNVILSTEHPVEVVGRIRDYPERKEKQNAIQLLPNGTTVRVRTELGYRDFSLDGVSIGEMDGLETFYKKFVQPRVNGVKTGGKCTVMMYGPTGSGKSHTMFGCANEPGIVYRALHDILGDYSGEDGRQDGALGNKYKVKVTVLEIYNEEIYDLLATNASSSGLNVGWSKNTACRVRLEVMGKKVKNAMFITGNDAGKIAKEVAKVEKRRVVKSTVCNDRSSRSHCLITLDVPAVGGRLMLVDMAGSENIDQAGLGFEAKLQTGKINQGNVALKRVVEAIANGDSHIPFRDSKLTMILQDSFEDDGAKILMVLCASPDPRDIHKTIGTLEYGAKAKCIVRCSNSPSKEKLNSQDIASTLLGARIAAMDEYISKLQLDNQLKDKEREAAQRELLKKEKEVAELKAKLEEMQEKQCEAQEKIVSKVEEKARLLKLELLRKFEECERSANIFVELGKKKMEEKILQQQEEVEMLRRRLEEIESELQHMKSNPALDSLQGTDANMEIEKKTSEIGEAGELVASSARFLEGMQACVQQMKDKYMSPQDEVQKFPSCTVSKGGNHLNDHVEVIPGNEKSLYSLGTVDESDKENLKHSNASYMPKLDSKAVLEEDSSMMDLSDQFNNLLYPVNKDERVLIHQRFPFLRSTTSNCGNDHHQYGDFEEEREQDDAELTRLMRRGQLPTVYEEEEEDTMEGDGIREDTSEKGIISNDRSHIQSDFVEARIVNGCSAESKTVAGHFEPNSQGEFFLKDCSNPALEKQVTEGNYDNFAGKLAKPVTSSDTNICHGNVGDSLLGTQGLHKDPTDFRKTRIQNIFFLCGNYRELARQARNPSPEKRPDPKVNLHDETPKESVTGCLLNLPGTLSLNNTPHEGPACNLSPEVAGLVSPILKTFSPQESKVISLTPSPDGSRKQDFKSPRRTPSRVIEAGASMPESLNLDTQIPTLKDVSQASSSYHTLEPGLSHSDGLTEQLIGIQEDQIQEDQKEKCDVYVKWETSKEASGKLIQILKMPRNANLADLRKMIEPYLHNTERDFIFLMLGDPSGAPVSREKEAGVQVTSLPDCHNQRGSRLACLRLPIKRLTMVHSPFNSLENKLPLSPSPGSSTTTNSPGHVSSCGSGSPLFAGRTPITKMGNSNHSMDSGGKIGQKVGGSGALLKGLRL